MFLIMSAAYIGQELESEFGQIPPSFLPLGNLRLFRYQIASAPEGVPIFLSVPGSYSVPENDILWLANNNVKIIYIPDGLSLGASLVASLNIAEFDFTNPLQILFGDTLIPDLPLGGDIVSVSEVEDNYNWAVVTDDKSHWLRDNKGNEIRASSKVVNGYFKLNQPLQLIKTIKECDGGFLDGLNLYNLNVGLSEIKVDSWLDFGHVNTYYRSKAKFTTQRSFNELLITSEWVEKFSVKSQKIRAEANWFINIPPSMRRFTPQYLGDNNKRGVFSYKLEYLHHTALNELFVFAELPLITWKQILGRCIEFLQICLTHKPLTKVPTNKLSKLFGEKTVHRLKEYCQNEKISLDDRWSFNGEPPISLSELLTYSEKYLPTEENSVNSVLHGDLCFSNILYDFRTGRIKIIDPRGVTLDGDFTIYGDIKYDIAKLSHSILGMYDWIVAGYYKVKVEGAIITLELPDASKHNIIQELFVKLIEEHFSLTAMNLYSMQIQLFLSMLPLHSDNKERQRALFANAFRLYKKLKELEQ
jgi:hypothetical protein